MQLKGFDLGNCWYFDQTLGEMLNIWRVLLEKLRCIWLQIEELTEFFLCYRWSLWSCHGSCDAWIKICHSYRGDGWGTFVSVLKSHPPTHTPPHPTPPCPWWELISFQGFLCEGSIGRKGTRKFTIAMNVSIFFSRIVARTELILCKHIFWLRTCETKTASF